MADTKAPPAPCPECGGERVWGTCGSDFYILKYNFHGAAFQIKHNITGAIGAVCTHCGHITLYATNPSNLTSKARK